MANSVTQTLAALGTAFTVRDIMIPAERLTRARDYDSARAVLEDPECRYDVIPLPEVGPMTQYVTRTCVRPKRIEVPLLVSDGTSILDLLDTLSDRQQFSFVLSRNCICGYVHYSDLNDSLVKVPFFVLLEAVERSLWRTIAPQRNDSVLEGILDPQRWTAVKKRLVRERMKNVDRGFEGILSFDEIIGAGQHLGSVKLTDTERQAIAAVRNRVDHNDRPLVPDLNHLTKIVQARDTAKRLIEELIALQSA